MSWRLFAPSLSDHKQEETHENEARDEYLLKTLKALEIINHETIFGNRDERDPSMKALALSHSGFRPRN